MIITTRAATNDDYDFLFRLKKASEYGPITATFGWDDNVQLAIHASEWAEGKPEIIMLNGHRIGSYLLQKKPEHWYFCRFFILPEHQGKGIGSDILSTCIERSQDDLKPIRLCHLKSNRVGQLYRRHGFTMTGEDQHFVYMIRTPK